MLINWKGRKSSISVVFEVLFEKGEARHGDCVMDLNPLFGGVYMFYRKDAVFMAALGVLAAAGFANAETITAPKVGLDPTVVTAQAADEPTTNLMSLLDKAGAAKPLTDQKIAVYG